MRNPTESRWPTLSLTVASPTEPSEADPATSVAYLPWIVAAAVWTTGAVMLGWLAVGLLVSAGWLTAVRLEPADVAATIGQGWLALHGAPARLGLATVDLPPLGLTLLPVLGCAAAAHHAAQQYELAPEAGPGRRWAACGGVTGACVATYALVTLVLASIVGAADQLAEAVLGGAAVAVVGAAPGAMVGLGLDPLEGRAGWLRCLPRAIGLGLATLASGSLAAVLVALVAHWSQVVTLHDALAPDPVGTLLLVLAQLAWWPTLLLWAGSFVLGAGVTLGPGSLVAPGYATVGVLPAVPVLGAVPTVPGPADWAWLMVGVAAGAASGWWLARGTGPTPLAGLWQGALTGLGAGAVWVAASWASVGALGVNRMAGLGPRFPELLLWGTVPLALAGAAAGVGTALWLARHGSERDSVG